MDNPMKYYKPFLLWGLTLLPGKRWIHSKYELLGSYSYLTELNDPLLYRYTTKG